MQKLTEDMIRVVTDSIGSTGRAVRDRKLVVYVGNHTLKDARGRQRRFAFPSAADRAAREFIAEHNQQTMLRWTRQGNALSYDGVEAIGVTRLLNERCNAKLSPVQCDAIGDFLCRMLNMTDLDTLTSVWKSKQP